MNKVRKIVLLTICAVAVVLLPRPIPKVLAQGQQCIASFATIWESACQSCCANYFSAGDINEITGEQDPSPGNQSAMDQQVNCGSPSQGCGWACGVGDYYVPYTDPSCCYPNYYYCGSDYDCCSDVCDLSAGTCVSCVPSGDQADSEFNCCSGTWSYAPWCD